MDCVISLNNKFLIKYFLMINKYLFVRSIDNFNSVAVLRKQFLFHVNISYLLSLIYIYCPLRFCNVGQQNLLLAFFTRSQIHLLTITYTHTFTYCNIKDICLFTPTYVYCCLGYVVIFIYFSYINYIMFLYDYIWVCECRYNSSPAYNDENPAFKS